MAENDAQLQLKKRARRRLVGAVVFVSVVAVLLPMVMDNEPHQVVHDVEIRIPGQSEKPFAPKFVTAPAEKKADKPSTKPEPEIAIRKEAAPASEPVKAKAVEKVVEKAVEKAADKPVEKAPEKVTSKPVEKPPAKIDDAKRAAAILAGQGADARPAAAAGEFLVLIGAFANEANVRNLKTKLGEQGIKTFTEPLNTPQGKKIRLRAGPFASRNAAEKALVKMQKIGVSGVVAAKE